MVERTRYALEVNNEEIQNSDTHCKEQPLQSSYCFAKVYEPDEGNQMESSI